MAFPMFLLRKTRVNLIRRGMQAGYIDPQAVRAHGLSEFIGDLAQRSFSLGPEPLTYEELHLNEVTALTIETANHYRPRYPTTQLRISGEALERYCVLAQQFRLPEPDRPTQHRYKLASDFLNLVGYEVLVPGAWPSKIGTLNYTPQLPEENDTMMAKDITDAASYLLSNVAYEHLSALALQLEYRPTEVLPQERFLKRRAPRTKYGISSFLIALSNCEFIDDRPPPDPGAPPLPLGSEWRFAFDKRANRTLSLTPQSRANYVALARRFHIHPQQRYTEKAIVGVVLEAIGLQFLVPVTLPTSHILHGPELTLDGTTT